MCGEYCVGEGKGEERGGVRLIEGGVVVLQGGSALRECILVNCGSVIEALRECILVNCGSVIEVCECNGSVINMYGILKSCGSVIMFLLV
jgi:hypothetical protein